MTDQYTEQDRSVPLALAEPLGPLALGQPWRGLPPAALEWRMALLSCSD